MKRKQMGKPYFAKSIYIEGGMFGDQKVAELSICTNDIEISDRAYNPETERDCLVITERERAMVKSIGCFKVLGKVSPTANWVKEGDVFSEDEIHEQYIDREVKIVELKCPCCGTFK